MIFKDELVEKEYAGAPLLLKFMAEDFQDYSVDKCGVEPVVTRVLESIPGDSSVHEDYRAIDLRQEHDGVFLYTQEQQEALLKYINEKYARNDSKPSMICHSFNGSPYHFHLQVAVFTKAYMP